MSTPTYTPLYAPPPGPPSLGGPPPPLYAPPPGPPPPGGPPPPVYMSTTTYYFRSRDPYSPSSPYVLNSHAVDSYGSGQTAYRVETDRKGRETKLYQADGTRLAKFSWQKKVPTVKLKRGEVKCREWAPLREESKTVRQLTLGDKTYLLSSRDGVYTISAENPPGRTVVVWQTKDRYLQLEAFPDVSVTPGLLDTCFIALTMIECGKDLGDAAVEAGGETTGQVAKDVAVEVVGASIGGALVGALAGVFH